MDDLDPDERRLGVLPANATVDDRLTGWQNLRFAAELNDLPRDGLDARISGLLDPVRAGRRATEPAGGYSTGMRQPLSLPRVPMHDPTCSCWTSRPRPWTLWPPAS